MFLQCSTLLVPICGEMATPLSLNFDGFARDMLGKDGNRRKKIIRILGVNIWIDRPIYNIPHMPSPIDFIPTGLHARCRQCSQSLCSRHWWRCPCLNASMVPALGSGWIDHGMKWSCQVCVCVTVSFRIMVKQMHNSKCRIACMCENCDHGAIMCHTSFHLK